ncbi:PIG-L family deacetylase [bacterium]|nr:PIG-L family deacetylase [bacterium]
MLGINLNNSRGLKILCLGAHSDDIEIGCGGTILSMLKKYKNTHVHWVVFSSEPPRDKEARSSANLFLTGAGSRKIQTENFRNGYFPYIGAEIKDYFETVKKRISPDIIFTHARSDLHQDHRIVSELTWNTFRNNLIFEYEIPKFDGDIGSPNVFVPLENAICQKKVGNLLNCFKSQNGKHWFTKEMFLSMLRIRGMECASSTNYAEAFYCRKIVL